MKIGLAADHAGFEYKEAIKAYLTAKGMEVKDFGTDSPASSDYPDYGHPLGAAVSAGELETAISICGSGEGMCMALNKHPRVRAALVWNEAVTKVTRQHNDANILCLPSRFIELEQAKRLVDVFLATGFEGGRHQRRIDKIDLS